MNNKNVHYMLYMIEVFPNLYIGTDYWNIKNTDGTIMLNYNETTNPLVISSIDIHQITLDTEPTWQQYNNLIKQTTGVIKKYLRKKKTLQIIGNKYNDLLFIVASMLINISNSSLVSILQYLARIVNVQMDENSNAMQSLIMYRFSVMVERAN